MEGLLGEFSDAGAQACVCGARTGIAFDVLEDMRHRITTPFASTAGRSQNATVLHCPVATLHRERSTVDIHS